MFLQSSGDLRSVTTDFKVAYEFANSQATLKSVVTLSSLQNFSKNPQILTCTA